MTFVVDASIAAAWFLPDEQNDAADALLADLRTTPGLVPSLFWYEMRNLFLTAERRGRFQSGEATLSMGQLRRLPLEDKGTGSDVVVLDIAVRNELSGYDASYVALAHEHGMPLATADRKMAEAARQEGVTIVGPLADK
jgi:predicted nucleic acid-binding protein